MLNFFPHRFFNAALPFLKKHFLKLVTKRLQKLLFFCILKKVEQNETCGHLTNPPPPYVDKHDHFHDTPSPLTGHVICERPL